MLRRHHTPTQPTSLSSRAAKSRMTARTTRRPGRPSSPWIYTLFALAALIAILTYVFPEQVQHAEQSAMDEVVQVEQDLIKWWSQPIQRPPIPQDEHPHFVGLSDPTERMKQQQSSLSSSYSWVEGEKEIKTKIKSSVRSPATRTRLGGARLDAVFGRRYSCLARKKEKEAEWQKQVDAKYDQMRREEEEWKRKITALLKAEKRG